MTTCTAADAATDAFAGFAEHYDDYTEHPAYRDWIVGLEALARSHGAPGRRALDLACGTGKSTAPLVELGYDVTGCDAVEAMLARARRKLGDQARVVRADVTELPSMGPFDLVTCLNDVINYLPDLRAVAAALDGAARNLGRGGVLVFDVNTLLTFRTTFATTFVRERSEDLFVWHGRESPAFTPGSAGRADIDAFICEGGGCFRRSTSVHVQRHHPLEDVARAVEAAGLELAGVYGQHDDGRRDPEVDETSHLKAVFVARLAHADQRKEVP